MEWIELHKLAMSKLNYRVVSPFVDAGGVSAVILTDKGNVYHGVCIDTSCTLGICAERNAIGNMITEGESKIIKIVCVSGDGKALMPCGACREFLMQLDKDSGDIEFLVNIETMETTTLGALIPNWWGSERFE